MKAKWQDVAGRHALGEAAQPVGNARKVAPREQTVPSEVMVPLLQAIVTGALLLILPAVVYAAALLIGWGAVWVAIVGVVILIVWGVLLRANRPLLWSVEEFMQFDINKDGQVGKVETVIRGEIKEGRTYKQPEFPGDPVSLRQFAQALLDGRARFSEAEAQRFDYKHFEALREVFFRNDWASWRDPTEHRQGIEVGLNGQGVLEILANAEI